MSVENTYCLDGWKESFTERPLSFVEFVDTYEHKDTIYPHILEKIKEISKKPFVHEYFIQGIVGSGKSTLIYLLTAYRVYLFLILKDPYKTFYLSPTNLLCMEVLGSKKGSRLFLNAFTSILECIPFFKNTKKKTSLDFESADSAWTTALPNDLITFKQGNSVLHCKSFKSNEDLIGVNVVIGIMTGLDYFQEDHNVSNAYVYKLMSNLEGRINSRVNGNPLSALIVDKYTNNYWSDSIDKYIRDWVPLTPTNMVITFQRYWEIFKNKDPNAELDSWFDVYEEKLVDKPETITDNIINFPSSFNNIALKDIACNNPESFIHDFIGVPLQTGMNKSSFEIMKQIKKLMYMHNINLSYHDGKMYLECEDDKSYLCLDTNEALN